MRICNPSCIKQAPQFAGVGCNVLDSTRSAIIQKLVFFICGLTWTSIVDPQEWIDNLAAENVGLSPEGSGSKPFPTYSEPIKIGCRPEINTKKEHAINFETPLVDTDAGTDFDDWNEIEGNQLVYNVAWLGCDGYLYGPLGIESGDEFGFPFTGQFGYVMEGTGKAKWQANLTIEYDREPKGYKLPDTVLAVLSTPVTT